VEEGTRLSNAFGSNTRERLSDVGHELSPQKPRANRVRTARFISDNEVTMHETGMLTNWLEYSLTLRAVHRCRRVRQHQRFFGGRTVQKGGYLPAIRAIAEPLYEERRVITNVLLRQSLRCEHARTNYQNQRREPSPS